MKTIKFAALAFLMTLGASVPFSADAGGDPCAFCDAIFAECRAAGGSLPDCRREYLECTYAFGCVIP